MRWHQRGLAGALVAVILVLGAVLALAGLALSKASKSGARNTEVETKFAALKQALIQFVAANGRLPCPSAPLLATGLEVSASDGVCDVAADQGTVPWKTIGARLEDSIDPWGNKISYRVYTGAAGSLTQSGGASMVQCDSVELTPVDTTGVTGSSGGRLCQPDSRITYRATLPGDFLTPATFFYDKGLRVDENGATKTGIAYVLISHGASGLGAYTSAGVRQAMPNSLGDEFINASTAGSATVFKAKAFSAPGTDPADANHFDDLLAYQSVEDLIKSAGQNARDWPEEAGTPEVTFNRTTVEAAVGGSVTPGSGVGQVSVTFAGVVASGLLGGSASQVAFDQASDLSWAGIGVAGGGSALLQSSAGEVLSLTFNERATKFAITMTNFGTYSGLSEIVEFRFFNDGVASGVAKTGVGCNIDGEGVRASFSINVGAAFDRVDITPLAARIDPLIVSNDGITALLVSEIKTCIATDATCTTSLATVANTCSFL